VKSLQGTFGLWRLGSEGKIWSQKAACRLGRPDRTYPTLSDVGGLSESNSWRLRSFQKLSFSEGRHETYEHMGRPLGVTMTLSGGG
jgi:hypothetical protein